MDPTEEISEDVLELIAETSAAAFAIDRSDRIIFFNEGAERLLGHDADRVLGRFCFDTIKGRDLFGNTYCTKECPIVMGAANGQVQEPFLLEATTRDGEKKMLRVRAVPLPGPGDDFRCLMHFLEPEEHRGLEELLQRLRDSASGREVRPEVPDPPLSVCPLTVREKEILRLLSNGYAALNIAARLNLSHATVRNHIQNILRKIDVHSQVEAIAVAFRRGWLTA